MGSSHSIEVRTLGISGRETHSVKRSTWDPTGAIGDHVIRIFKFGEVELARCVAWR